MWDFLSWASLMLLSISLAVSSMLLREVPSGQEIKLFRWLLEDFDSMLINNFLSSLFWSS